MIDDSNPWKLDLARAAIDLERRKSQRRWSDASFVKIEKLVLHGAFAVRKLIESDKLSDEVEALAIAAKAFPLKARYIDRLNRTKIDKLYDLAAPRDSPLALEALCNQLIHSYVFTPIFSSGGGLHGVFVASDRMRVRCCLLVTVDALADAFRKVAFDDIVWFESARAAVGEELTIVRKSNRIPPESLAPMRDALHA